MFCTDRPVAEPERGDLLAVGNTGAYGVELASRFHSQPLPGEVTLRDGETRLTREPETVDDVTARERSF
ncbi:MAG: Diaminopimelate decarboxylase [halophilic archaeon J07HB67]|nr:MAG: Diaminopimelate decarboxylase [halophilic archaeon J07HB67]